MKLNAGLSMAAGGKLQSAADWLENARRVAESKMPAGGDHANSGDTRLALQVLLAHALGKSRAWVIAHPEAQITAAQAAHLDEMLARFVDGTPLSYLLGRWEFYGRSFTVTPATLIPRPETESLVDEAVTWLRQNPSRRRAVDVGTGSGCIAVSLAKSVPNLRVLAVDRSFAALRVARANAQEHECAHQIDFLHSDLLRAASGPFDLVCANLPYIPTNLLAELPVALHEPSGALDGGPDGLDAIRALVTDAPRWLAPGGLLLLEMQYDQGDAIAAMLRERLPQANVSILPDLAGLPRLVRAEEI